LLLLTAGIFCAVSQAAPAGAKNDAAKAPAAAAGDFVGSETCATCHEEVANKFASNKHAKLAEEHQAKGAGCESCHGPGKAHVEGGGDTSKIFNPAKASAKDVTARCLTCHAGAHPNFDRSPHAKANVSCVSCHSVHTGDIKNAMLKAPQPQLCFQCHNDVKPQFSMPFHHKVNEGAVSCNDCHDVHGSFGNSNLKSTADQNAVCTKCHMEKRGPFVYEHAAVKGEGCLSCHTPHGSQNARLLNMPSINVLCNQCHSMVATNSIHNSTVLNQSSDITPCIGCHTMIHGSNLDQYLKR
jgi:DmsE family decaheme c-type cytochrome